MLGCGVVRARCSRTPGREFTATEANTRWCRDITYIMTWNGWAYLATVIDLHSRALVGWALNFANLTFRCLVPAL
jgi:transposase InsO family protein